LVRSFFLFVVPTLEFALFGLEPTFAVRNASIFGIARFKLLSVGRVASAHGDLCNEHTKGQQRAVSSTFRVLTQAQYQTRAVAAKKSHLEAVAKILTGGRFSCAADQNA
jgi:hypothetical protein